MKKMLVTFVLLQLGACGGEQAERACAPEQGFLACGVGTTCQPGQYCFDDTFGECQAGCLSNVNCSCDQECTIAAGASVGTCSLRADEDDCGNGACDPGESHSSCAADCPAPVCGDGRCDANETAVSCASDCPPECGDGVCQPPETSMTCLPDCPDSGTGACKDECSAYDFFQCLPPGGLQMCFDACDQATPAQIQQFLNCANPVDPTECQQLSCFAFLP